MIKKLAILALLALVLCSLATFSTFTAFAETADESQTIQVTQTEKVYNTTEKIIYYSLAGVALLFGIPLYVAMKKRDKREPYIVLSSKVNTIRNAFEIYCKKWETEGNKPVRKQVKLNLYIQRAIDLARNAYYDKREGEYNEIEQRLSKISELINGSEKKKENELKSVEKQVLCLFNQIHENLDVLTIRKTQIRRIKKLED